MKIPLSELSPAALTGIIESFVLREGTDYGTQEADFQSKCRDVRRQLERGEAEIWYDAVNDSIDLRPALPAAGSRRRN